MRLSSLARLLSAALCVAVIAAGATPANAQFGGGGGLGGGGGGFGGGGGLGGGLGGGGGGGLGGGTNGASGVVVDADGVVRRNIVPDPSGELTRQRIAQSVAGLDAELSKRSKLRKVSITRLERLLEQKLAAGQAPDDAMLRLAGLTHVDYVFCYPDTGDIVLAGPAEPWADDLAGRTRGVATGRPTLLLEDLITALRAFPPAAAGAEPLIYCSIDPTEEGLAGMQQFLRQPHFNPNRKPTQTEVSFFVEQLRSRMGLQKVTVGGIPAGTHFAQVMVEADYRMKLIGIGLERPPVRLKSYVHRANPAMVSRNALQRWYFVPDYDCLRVSEDGLAMEVVGEGVKLIGEDEFVGQDGTRRASGQSNRASESYTKAFTKVYPKLAERSPVYAQLRNCIDLAVVAAFLQQRDVYGQAGWTMPVFASEEAFPIETYNPPQQVATAVNAIWKNNTLVTPIGGGVEIRPTWALRDGNLQADAKGKVSAKRTAVGAPQLADGQWWWD
ncbi:MAG: DUF1598 domain-containing protein [Planctomycetota bacterium]